MPKSLNRAMLLGNMGKSAEVRSTAGGTTVASFSIATTHRVKDGREGEWRDETVWHNCVAFGKLAEVVRDYTAKGSRLYVEGRLQTRSWDDKDSGQKKYRTEIIVADVTLLDGRKSDAPRTDDGGFEAHPAITPGGYDNSSDVPF